jgi:hypothetical protein
MAESVSVALARSQRDPLAQLPRKIGLELNPDESLEFWIVTEGDERVGESLKFSRRELQDLCFTLLDAWQGLIGYKSGPTDLQNKVTQEVGPAADARVKFAAVGNYALHQLLDRMSIPLRTRFSDILQSMVKMDSPSPLLVVSKEMFPWRMLYVVPGDTAQEVDDNDDPNDVPIDGFLGMAGIVDQEMTRRLIPDEVNMLPAQIHFALNSRLTSTAGARRPDIKAAVSSRADLEIVFAADETALVDQLKTNKAVLIYVFAHGKFRPGPGGGRPIQEIILRNNRSLTALELERRLKNTVLRRPISIINACQAGVWPEQGVGIVNVLRDHGADGVSGPLVDMPIYFGAEFGSRVLELLASGFSLSGALLESTRYFASEHSNLLGLSYLSINGARAYLPTF